MESHLTCGHPDFRQSLPKPADEMELVAGNKRTGTLHYRDLETGENYIVPNIWYNQTVSHRVDASLWNAQRNRERASKLRKENDIFPQPWIPHQIDATIKQAERLEELALEMQSTGKVLA